MTKPSTPNLTLVVNPASGRGRAKRLLPGLVQRLQRELPGVDLDGNPRIIESAPDLGAYESLDILFADDFDG